MINLGRRHWLETKPRYHRRRHENDRDWMRDSSVDRSADGVGRSTANGRAAADGPADSISRRSHRATESLTRANGGRVLTGAFPLRRSALLLRLSSSLSLPSSSSSSSSLFYLLGCFAVAVRVRVCVCVCVCVWLLLIPSVWFPISFVDLYLGVPRSWFFFFTGFDWAAVGTIVHRPKKLSASIFGKEKKKREHVGRIPKWPAFDVDDVVVTVVVVVVVVDVVDVDVVWLVQLQRRSVMVLALLQQLRFRFENTVRRRPQPCRNPETYNLVAKTHNLIERLLFPLRFPLQVLFFYHPLLSFVLVLLDFSRNSTRNRSTDGLSFISLYANLYFLFPGSIL